MFGPRRYHDDISGHHIERPLGYAVFGAQQHSNENFVIGGGTLRANAGAESVEAEREVVDSKVRNAALQLAAAKLHDIKMRSLDGVLQTLEAIEVASFD